MPRDLIRFPHPSPTAHNHAFIVCQVRPSKFTRDEQITMMTLWSIARSPLIHGGDLTKTDEFTWSLLTNDEVIAVDQHSDDNRQPFRTADDHTAWTAAVPGSADRYPAVFNAANPASREAAAQAIPIPVQLADLGLTGRVKVRDLWTHQERSAAQGTFSPTAVPHGARLFRLSPLP